MKRINYHITEAPTGETIRYIVRMKSYLLVFTNFDAFRFIDFAEKNLSEINGIEKFVSINAYDDSTGYYILLLRKECNKETLFTDIQEQFKKYFSANKLT